MPLEAYYTGDAAWHRFVHVHKEANIGNVVSDELVAAVGGDADLAAVLSSWPIDALSWIYQKVPALDGLTPLESLSQPRGVERLRECLMRFSC